MSRTDRYVSIGTMILPFAAFVVAVVLLWERAVDGTDLALLAVMYLLTAMGITVGFHRLFTHRSFRAKRPVELTFAILGSMAGEGPIAHWVADHRKHHAHTDTEGDPHSPHEHGGLWRGLWHAHMGWLVVNWGMAERERYARDVMEDRALRLIQSTFVVWFLLGLAIPFAIGGWSGLLWGGFVRLFLLHHVTWSINSICHVFGQRRFAVDDRSTNVAWLSLASLGESWHHNHHAFPRSHAHGLGRWELDPSAWVIRGLERAGLAEGVVRITPERQAEKLAA